MTDVNVKGLKELQDLLDKLPAKMEANIMRGAMRAGMKVVMPIAKQNINDISGELSSSLKIVTSLRRGVVKAKLRAQGEQGMKAIWVEYGTQPHLIKVSAQDKHINARLSRKRGKKVLESVTTVNRRSLKISQKFIGPTISHPGAKAKPFLRPALDSQAEAAVLAAGSYIKKRLATKHGIDTKHINLEGDEDAG